MAQENGYTRELIKQLEAQRLKQNPDSTKIQKEKKWTTFTYFGPSIRTITNIFKGTQLNIAFRPTNTIGTYIKEYNIPQDDLSKSGIYEINCHTCDLKYIGQTSRDILTRFKEHCRYIRQNNPQSAYALHILNIQHEFSPAHNTIKLIKQYCKHRNLLLWEIFHIQNYSRNNQLINEQSKPEYNILYDLHTYNYAQPHSATYTPQNTGMKQSVSDGTWHGTHTIGKYSMLLIHYIL